MADPTVQPSEQMQPMTCASSDSCHHLHEMKNPAHQQGTQRCNGLQTDVAIMIASLLEHSDLLNLRLASQEWHDVATSCIKSIEPRSALRLLANSPKRFSQLTSINLRRIDALSHEHLRCLKAYPCLTELSLGPAINNAGYLPALNTLTNLTSLSFRGCQKITWNDIADNITNLGKVKHFNCANITYKQGKALDPKIDHLLKGLRSLTLGDGCAITNVDDGFIDRVSQQCRKLTHLDCVGCLDITDEGLESITSRLASQLTSLSLRSCVRLTQGGFITLLPALTNLGNLNLRGCISLNDQGLSSLSTLTRLTELSVQSCRGLIGHGFAALTTCQQLAILNARDCEAIRKLDGIAMLKSLKELDVSGCKSISLEELAGLGALPGLKSLNASGLKLLGRVADNQQLNEVLSSRLDQLTGLQALDLSQFCHPQGAPSGLFKAISCMTSLTSLRLAGMCAPPQNYQSDYDFIHHACRDQLFFLANLQQLRLLDLSSWHHTPPCALQHVSRLSNLTHLNISRFGNDQQHSYIVPDREVRYAQQHADETDSQDDNSDSGSTRYPYKPCGLTCTCASTASKSKGNDAFTYLHQSVHDLEDHMAACALQSDESYTCHSSADQGCDKRDPASLTGNCQEVTAFDRCMQWIAHCSQLQTLDMTACNGLTDAGLAHMSKLAQLRHLSLGGCKILQGTSLAQAAASNTSLRSLVLEDCVQLHPTNVMAAMTHLQGLMELQLGGCNLIGDEVCQQLNTTQLPNLRNLSFRGCHRITSHGVKLLGMGAPHLETLNLSHCWAVEADAVLCMVRVAKCLTYLGLQYCWRVDDPKALASIVAASPSLCIETAKTRITGQSSVADSVSSDSEDLDSVESTEGSLDSEDEFDSDVTSSYLQHGSSSSCCKSGLPSNLCVEAASAVLGRSTAIETEYPSGIGAVWL